MFTHTPPNRFTSFNRVSAAKPVISIVETYALVPEPSSGSASGSPSSSCASPQIGHSPTPEQSGSTQSHLPSQSSSALLSQLVSVAAVGGQSPGPPPGPPSPPAQCDPPRGPHPNSKTNESAVADLIRTSELRNGNLRHHIDQASRDHSLSH